MAIAFVQVASSTITAGTTITATFGSGTTSGNAVIVGLAFNTGKTTVGTITQSAGDTTAVPSGASLDVSGSYVEQRVAYGVGAGSTAFTFSWSGSTIAALLMIEVSGLQASGFDVTANSGSFTSATTHSTGTTATLAQASELAVAVWNGDGSGNTTISSVSNSFTVPASTGAGGGNQLASGASNGKGALAYLITAATTGVESTLTTADSESGTGLIVTFKAASATRGLFLPPALSGVGIGGSFFRDPLQGAGA